MAETEAHISSEEDQLFRLLRQLDIAPDAPQRATAEAVGLSLGRLNALIRDAIDQGLVRSAHDCSDGGLYVAIAEMAEKSAADLIVINSHRPGVQDYFLGSTASRVVRRAPCAVMVLR